MATRTQIKKKGSRGRPSKAKVEPAKVDTTHSDEEYEVEKITQHVPRNASQKDCMSYIVKWKGYSDDDNTIENAQEIFESVPKIVAQYWKSQENTAKKVATSNKKRTISKSEPKAQTKKTTPAKKTSAKAVSKNEPAPPTKDNRSASRKRARLALADLSQDALPAVEEDSALPSSPTTPFRMPAPTLEDINELEKQNQKLQDEKKCMEDEITEIQLKNKSMQKELSKKMHVIDSIVAQLKTQDSAESRKLLEQLAVMQGASQTVAADGDTDKNVTAAEPVALGDIDIKAEMKAEC